MHRISVDYLSFSSARVKAFGHFVHLYIISALCILSLLIYDRAREIGCGTAFPSLDDFSVFFLSTGKGLL